VAAAIRGGPSVAMAHASRTYQTITRDGMMDNALDHTPRPGSAGARLMAVPSPAPGRTHRIIGFGAAEP